MSATQDMGRDADRAIEHFLTPEQPFGPPEADTLFSDTARGAEVLFDRSNLIFAHAEALRPIYVVGRKGAGKTAFLFGSTRAPHYQSEQLKTSAVYSRYLATVVRYERLQTPLFADQLAMIWRSLFAHVAAFHVWRTSGDGDRLHDLQVVWDYVRDVGPADPTALAETFLNDLIRAAEAAASGAADLDDLIGGITHGGRQFREVRTAVSNVLGARRSSRLVIVMDNLEDLHFRIADVRPALQGLFRCVGELIAGKSSTDFEIRVCLPSEPYDQLHLLSVNPAKDFRRVLFIYWSAQELLHLVGARLRLFLASHHPDELDGLRARAIQQGHGDDDIALLRAALPPKMENGLGIPEDPVAYLLRHTQLLPRHLIEVLNAVFGQRPHQGSMPWCVTEQAILSGTRAAERVIVPSILSAYSGSTTDILAAVRSLANRLPIRFAVSSLHKVFNQEGVRRNTGLDFDEFLRLLISIGAVGVYTDETDRYYRGVFQYTFNAPLGAVEDSDQLVVHPLFTRYLHEQSLPRMRGSTKVTYPQGCDPAVDYRIDHGYPVTAG